MHHCLAIAEIQHLIFEIIREEDYPFLATLAHTCRAFKESALNSLWYELSGISPLFRCLPQEAWERETDPTYSWKRRPLVSRIPSPLTNPSNPLADTQTGTYKI